MARLWYGGTPADFVVRQGDEASIYALNPVPPNSPIATDLFGTAALLPLAARPFDVYTDAELTALTTSLLDAASAAITQVTPGDVKPNLATPGTFETDLESWTAGGTLPPTVTRDNTRAKHGTWSMKVVWDTGGTFPSVHKTITGLTIGVRYTAFGFAWVVAGDPGVSFVVSGITGAHHQPTTVEEDWVPFEYSFLATATSHSLQIWPSVSPTAGDTLWVDDIIVQEASDPELRGAIPRFQGPDGHEGPLWLSIDGVTGYRVEPESGPLYTRAAAFDADIVVAQTDITDAETDLGALDVRTDALEAAATPDFQRFSSSGSFTWTKPAGAKSVFVECLGGGASGGGAAATAAGQASEGGGGGGGGYVARWYDADELDATENVTVGAGGAAGGVGSNGNDGNDSSFGGLITGSGGLAGSAGSASAGPAYAAGGHGSSGSNDANQPIHRGGDGGSGVVIATAVTVRKNVGGSSFHNGEGTPNASSANISGSSGARGQGGGGARNGPSQSARTGGGGGTGLVQVTTYF
jgi:hypothetical protein